MSLQAKKSFGQHFLKNPGVVRAIIEATEIVLGETVLEIGPGTGVLTEALVEAGAHVVAVEADRDLIEPLKERFGDAIELFHADALLVALDVPKVVASPYKLVSNLPYNVGTEIIERFLRSPFPPSRFIVMVQKEVGDRMLAQPGEMSLLSVAIQLYAKPSRVIRVSPGSFVPPPKVDSLVVRLDPQCLCDDPEPVIALAKIGFSAKRKQLHRNLADAGVAKSENIKAWLEMKKYPPTARAQELRAGDWVELHAILESSQYVS